MRIALATCTKLPEWEVDDQPLFDAFVERGVEIEHPAWDDPNIDWAGFDACLIRTTWDYAEKRDEFVKWVEETASVTHIFNDPKIIRWNTHKSYLRDLQKLGAPIPPTIWCDAGTDVDIKQIVDERGWSRAIIKPVIGASARETLRFRADSSELRQAQAHIDRLLKTESVMIQPYLAKVETEGELSAIFIDGQFSHAVRKIPVPGDYRVQDDFGASDEGVELNEAARALSKQILSLIEADLLYARVDFLSDDDGRLLLSELELVEPSLFFRHSPIASKNLAKALCKRVSMAQAV